MNKAQIINQIQLSLKGRYRSISLGIFVIIGIIVFLLFLFEIIKFIKKIYTHNIPHNQNKYLVSKILNQKERLPQLQTQVNINNPLKASKVTGKHSTIPANMLMSQKGINYSASKRQQTLEQLGKSVKSIPTGFKQPEQDRLVKFLSRSIDLIKQKLPIIAIAIVNVSLIASFEFLLVTLCIGILLFIVIQILRKNQQENVAWILELIAHGIVIGWFINMITVGMPV